MNGFYGGKIRAQKRFIGLHGLILSLKGAYMTIGERLREARKANKMSKKKLAELSGVDSKSIYRLESNKVINPKVETIKPLILALQCNSDEILFGDSEYVLSDKLKSAFLNASSLTDEDKSMILRMAKALRFMEQAEEVAKPL